MMEQISNILHLYPQGFRGHFLIFSKTTGFCREHQSAGKSSELHVIALENNSNDQSSVNIFFFKKFHTDKKKKKC